MPLRELMDDRLLDALLARSRDEAGGLRLTGEGSMLGELVKAVLEQGSSSRLRLQALHRFHGFAPISRGPALPCPSRRTAE